MANTINATSGIGIVSTADNTNILALQTNGTTGLTIDASQNVSFAKQLPLTSTATTIATLLQGAAETVTVFSASGATGTIAFDITSQGVLFYTTNAAANFTINLRASSTTNLNTALAVGQSVSCVFLNTNGTTPYYCSAVQVDGSSVTPKWLNSTPAAGNASAIDAYTFTVIKTASATYTVLAVLAKFA